MTEETHLIGKQQKSYASILSDESNKMPTRKESFKKTSSILSVSWNMINAILGAGILGTPNIFKKSGIITGIILIFIFALLCCYTLYLLIKTALLLNVNDFGEMGYKCYGNYGYILVNLSLFLLDFGVIITNLVITADASFLILQLFGYHSNLDRAIILIAVSMIFIFPLCLFRDVALLEKCSIIKILSIVFVILVVIIEFIKHYISNNI